MACRALRALLRFCRLSDRQPSWLLAVVLRPPRKYEVQYGQVLRSQLKGSPFAEDMLWEACGRSTQFAMPQGTAARACRRHYRRAMALGLPYEACQGHWLV